MVEMRTAISIGEAIHKVMDSQVGGLTEMVPLTQAHHRFLAEDILANQDVPAFNRALYDGFAIRAEDTINASDGWPIVFRVIEEIGAGSVFSEAVRPFQAVRIMTGAQIPDDCDAVIMLEHVREFMKDDKKNIEINRIVHSGDCVFRKGEEIQEGDCLVQKGTRITPGVIGLLATFGYSHVPVGKKPIVGILATGSELLDIHEPLARGKIRNSNSYMLMSQVEKAGGEPLYLGKLEDDLEKSIQVIKETLPKVDLLITTGGVSVGDFDFLPEIYKRIGATVLFNKIAMRPGSVTTVAKLGEQLLFGLSGNPSASFIGFELFVRPIIRRSLGNEDVQLSSVQAILDEDFLAPNDFTQLIRTTVFSKGTQMFVSSNGLNMSSSITSLAGADALLVLPPKKGGYRKGAVADILLLTEEKGRKESLFNRKNN